MCVVGKLPALVFEAVRTKIKGISSYVAKIALCTYLSTSRRGILYIISYIGRLQNKNTPHYCLQRVAAV